MCHTHKLQHANVPPPLRASGCSLHSLVAATRTANLQPNGVTSQSTPVGWLIALFLLLARVETEICLKEVL